MSSNISVFGLTLSLIASTTFPTGVVITAFADDQDPFDLEEIIIGAAAMGQNGDMVKYSTPAIIPVSLNIIPGSPSDELLSILMQNNMVGLNKSSKNDQITLTGVYPSNLKTVYLSDGIIVSGMPGPSGASSGRQKTKPFKFNFGKVLFI